MIYLNEVCVVEGVYDKIKLGSLVASPIVETNGFRIFKDKEKRAMLKALAAQKGLVILTDSDAAGFKIRNHIATFIPKEQVKNAYIPHILGKEKRKTTPSAEGKLGVEGMSREVLLAALKGAGVLEWGQTSIPCARAITKRDFYEDGLTGGEHSAERRAKLLAALNLPGYITTNSLLPLLNTMLGFEGYKELVKQL